MMKMGLGLDERQYLTFTLTIFHIFSLCSTSLAIPNPRYLQLYSVNDDETSLLRRPTPVLVIETSKSHENSQPQLDQALINLSSSDFSSLDEVPKRQTRQIDEQHLMRFGRRVMNNVGEKMYQIQGVGDLPMFRFGRR